MRIGIDARLYNQTGVGKYLRNLILELSNIDRVNEYIVYFKKSDFEYFKPNGKNWKKKLLDVNWHSLKEQFIVPKILIADKLDVVHFPYFNIPIFYPGKYLLTIHDLIVDHFDTGRASTRPIWVYKIKRLAYKIITKEAIRKAKAISTISQSTKNEVIDHYGVNSELITVTFDALDKNFLTIRRHHDPKSYYNFPYVLYVGNAYPHKNLEKLIRAWQKISNKSEFKIVLAGDDKFFFPRLEKFTQKLNLTDKIIFYGLANDEQLINLYSNAKCLVFPSLMEGFGLPNFEALACNCLPVVSDIPVFREIWSDKLIYYDPYSVDDMADKILSVINLSPKIYRQKVEKAKSILTNYSWKETARLTLWLYQQINQLSK